MMKNRNVRGIISMVLIVMLVLSTTAVAFAATPDNQRENKGYISEAEIQKEIKAKQQDVMDSVYEQLKEQGRLDFLEDYKEILLPEIESEVRERYSCNAGISTQAGYEYNTFWEGGVIANTTVSGKNALCTYLNRDDSYEYILDSLGSYHVAPIVEAILGALPEFGPAFTVLFTLRTIGNVTLYKKIKDAGGYSKTLTLRDPVTRDYSSVLLAWDTYPTGRAYAVSDLESIQAKAFPKHEAFQK